jgi:hypothetical protein
MATNLDILIAAVSALNTATSFKRPAWGRLPGFVAAIAAVLVERDPGRQAG